MEKFFNFDLGFFSPIDDVVNFGKPLGVSRTEVFTIADVGDLS